MDRRIPDKQVLIDEVAAWPVEPRPKHGSWLNLVEGFFSKLARSALRHIRVASKQELEDRIMAAIDVINPAPWSTHGRICLRKLHDPIRSTKSL